MNAPGSTQPGSLFSERDKHREPKIEPCPDQGRYGFWTHERVDGVCVVCESEEAARRARLEERGIFFGR